MKAYRKIKMIAMLMLMPLLGHAQEGVKELQLAIDSRTYHTAIGIRAGETSGLTIKQFIGQKNALEGILGVWHHGLSATLLYERHAQAFDISGLNWYFGAGGHVSASTSHTDYYHHRGDRHYYYHSSSVGLGVDGIFGMEYKIPNAPMAVSLDVKPYAEVISTGGIWMSIDPGLGIKVVF